MKMADKEFLPDYDPLEIQETVYGKKRHSQHYKFLIILINKEELNLL